MRLNTSLRLIAISEATAAQLKQLRLQTHVLTPKNAWSSEFALLLLTQMLVQRQATAAGVTCAEGRMECGLALVCMACVQNLVVAVNASLDLVALYQLC